MSMSYTNYVIYGWDLTDYIDYDKLEDWKWESGEEYFCNQRAGYIQIFDGGANDDKVRFGYVIWSASEYDYNGDVSFTPDDLCDKHNLCCIEDLYSQGISKINFAGLTSPRIICFRELE